MYSNNNSISSKRLLILIVNLKKKKFLRFLVNNIYKLSKVIKNLCRKMTISQVQSLKTWKAQNIIIKI